jgi:hypothetical protein
MTADQTGIPPACLKCSQPRKRAATTGEKQENHGRRRLVEETDLLLKTMLVTTLVPSEAGFRSKVVQVNLGDMPAWLAEKVAEHFPVGFCRSGSGEPCSE